MPTSELLTLEEAARVAGHARWLETRLFEVLGSWVATEPDAAAKVLWSTQSLHHATGAEVWRDRQPRVAHLDRDTLTQPAGPGVVALLDALADLAGVADAEAPGDTGEPAVTVTVSRLVAVTRVVEPRRLSAYRDRCRRAHPLADGPTVRWTRFLLADGDTGRSQAEALLTARLLAARLVVPDMDEGARAVEAGLGSLLADAGGLIGLKDGTQA